MPVVPVLVTVGCIMISIIIFMIKPENERNMAWFFTRLFFTVLACCAFGLIVATAIRGTERTIATGTITQMKDIIVNKSTRTQVVLSNSTVKTVTVGDGALLKTGQKVTLDCPAHGSQTEFCRIGS